MGKIVPQGITHQLVIQYQRTIPENIYIRNTQTSQVIFKNIYIYSCTNNKRKRGKTLKENKEGHKGEFGEKKRERRNEVIIL